MTSWKRPLPLALTLLLAGPAAHAACIEERGIVCGNPQICVSDQRPEGIHDPHACLPPTVCQVLGEMAKAFADGGKLEILSADRTADCRKRGGAGCNSAHAGCRAVDVLVPGIYDELAHDAAMHNKQSFSAERRAAQRSRMLPFLHEQQEKGAPIRYNIYCTGVVHIDDMPDPTKPDARVRKPESPANISRADSYDSCVEEMGAKVWPRPNPRFPGKPKPPVEKPPSEPVKEKEGGGAKE